MMHPTDFAPVKPAHTIQTMATILIACQKLDERQPIYFVKLEIADSHFAARLIMPIASPVGPINQPVSPTVDAAQIMTMERYHIQVGPEMHVVMIGRHEGKQYFTFHEGMQSYRGLEQQLEWEAKMDKVITMLRAMPFYPDRQQYVLDERLAARYGFDVTFGKQLDIRG